MIELVSIIMFSTPVVLAATGDCIAQRAGILNIGLEGQMLMSAFVGVTVAATANNPWLGLVAGGLTGILVALLGAVFVVGLCADQVVVGIATTLLSLGVTGSLYRARFAASQPVDVAPSFAKFFGGDAVMVCGIALAIGVSFLFYRTRIGLRLRAVGEHPEAAESVGARVGLYRWVSMSAAGAFAGLAGGYLSIGVAGAFTENMTQGRGFLAIAMVTFGRWKPHWIVLCCLLVGWLESLQFAAQARGWQVPFQLLLAAPYAFALVVLVLAGKGSRAPAALGVPYRRTR